MTLNENTPLNNRIMQLYYQEHCKIKDINRKPNKIFLDVSLYFQLLSPVASQIFQFQKVPTTAQLQQRQEEIINEYKTCDLYSIMKDIETEVQKSDQKILEKLSSLKQYDSDIQNNIFSIRDHNTLYSLKFIDKLQNITDNTKVTVKNCELLNFDEVPTKIEDLTIESCSIENLEGIQQMKQLKALTISKNQLENTDLSQLYYMKKLNYLNLSSNQLGDNQSLFQNQLEKQLSNLTILDLKDNKITKVPSFQCMQFLMQLNLSCNNISDISPLYSNNNLQTLIVEDNKIISLNHRTAQHNILQNLQILSLQRNSLIDITDLQYIICLTHLDLSVNQIIDIKPLKCLVNMQYLNLDRNRIYNIWPLKYLTLLEELMISYNSIVDIHVLKYLNVVNIVKLNYNEVHDVSVLNNKSLELVEARSNFIQDFYQIKVKSSTLQSQMRDDALQLQANLIKRIFLTNDLLQNVRDKKITLNSQKFRNKIDELKNEAVRSQITFTTNVVSLFQKLQ
ncbi:leucine-rich_repeat domain-containing protein [Hexamita inflata]|uniref:Leucine-rich repeat domain-containing protein n=1 Tax=Hexamita inflata TaxID=28002 RepID=A0AA86TUN1_9EUKA|nr:leucine-rich repeat domain-containing protein [Hexamita inflata]